MICSDAVEDAAKAEFPDWETIDERRREAIRSLIRFELTTAAKRVRK